MTVHKDKVTGKWYYTGKYKDLVGKRHDYKKRGFTSESKARKAESFSCLQCKRQIECI